MLHDCYSSAEFVSAYPSFPSFFSFPLKETRILIYLSKRSEKDFFLPAGRNLSFTYFPSSPILFCTRSRGWQNLKPSRQLSRSSPSTRHLPSLLPRLRRNRKQHQQIPGKKKLRPRVLIPKDHFLPSNRTIIHLRLLLPRFPQVIVEIKASRTHMDTPTGPASGQKEEMLEAMVEDRRRRMRLRNV